MPNFFWYEDFMAIAENYKNELISIVHKYLPKSMIYLFGSRALNKERAGSDIAVDASHKIDHSILKILIDIDDTTIPMKVDLVDLYSASADLKHDILCEGIEWTN
jgi:predicted nucleotidyltransferase